MSEYSYLRHGINYKASQENCDLNASLDSDNQCEFSYFSSMFGGEYEHDYDSDLGYTVASYNQNGQNILRIAFTGTENFKDLQTDYNQFIGKKGVDQYEKANSIVKNLLIKYDNYQVILTGHSLGGAIATYVGLIHDLEVVAFNSARLSGNSTNSIVIHNKDIETKDVGNIENVTQIRLMSDKISSPWITETSALFGKQFILPSGSNLKIGHSIKGIIEELESIKDVDMTKKVCQSYYGYHPYN